MATEISSKVYEPKKVEQKWYSLWLSRGYFEALINGEKKPFTIVIPPPNVTGSLHMGHALNNILQDIVIRKRRMEGYVTLWLPGTDHAGIATQNVVEQELASEGLSREKLGREKFLERVWQWKEKYGNLIIEQLKGLGCSCDWDRTRFTMDEGYTRAVREVFVRLYQEGLIYRGNYLVNWCPRCQTALSDIEVEHREVQGHLWHIRYPFDDTGKDYLTIATTRPETLLGDTAVAVHPKDKRYQKHLGKTLVLPVLGRKLPVIADDYVDPKFGTGAVKVTPAHDPNDFEIGQRHKLPTVNIFTPEAKINENGGKYQGLDRYRCREILLKDLEKTHLLEKVEDYTTSIGHCYRCDAVVEPYLSEQWFIRMKPLAEPAIKAVRDGRVKFFPARWEKVYFEWMGNIRDWCISRQIWWGHQLPVYYCKQEGVRSQKSEVPPTPRLRRASRSEGCGEIIVSREKPQKCPNCGSTNLVQDPDVLDTWFSSALWPFATLGWPDDTPDLNYFYPTSLLSTGFDIIYFWVARMIMMGIHFPKDVPFKEVYIHALIRDVEGQKMSKSRGNVIDPLEVIENYGTDSLRFTLASLAAPGRDVYLSEERIQGYRNFMNKIWNASRFILMNLSNYSQKPEARSQKPENQQTNQQTNQLLSQSELADRWILSRYNRVIAQVNEEMESFAFNKACKTLYDFFWGDFCDWYIELAKPRLQSQESGVKSQESENQPTNQPTNKPTEREVTQHVLVTVLEGVLRLIHPFAPFITEEIWQKLPHPSSEFRVPSSEKESPNPEPRTRNPEPSIMVAEWPESDPKYLDEEAEKKMAIIQEVTAAARSLRSKLKIPPAQKIKAFLRVTEREKLRILREYSGYFAQLANVSELSMGEDIPRPKHSMAVTVPGAEIFVPLEGLDFEAESERVKRGLEEVQAMLEKVEKKLSTPQFMAKAPPEVIKKEQDKLSALADKKRKLKFQLDQLG